MKKKQLLALAEYMQLHKVDHLVTLYGNAKHNDAAVFAYNQMREDEDYHYGIYSDTVAPVKIIFVLILAESFNDTHQ